LREQMLREMREKAAGERAPHNKLYRPERDGLATTFAGFIAAALEIRNPYRASRAEVEQIKQAHLLLAAANALQPGVFSLSSWDLVGALPISERSVADRVADGDYRWINRGGVDLMGANPQAKESAFGIERAVALYGPLPEQLKDSGSFAERLREILAARKKYRFAEGELRAVPAVTNKACCVLVLQVPGEHLGAITALNFSDSDIEEPIDCSELQMNADGKTVPAELIDALTEERPGRVPASGRMTVQIPARSARALIVRQAK
jgi:trehalose synthase